jgi:hypothetical protein
MQVRNWPLSARRALAWALILLSFAIAIIPLSLLTFGLGSVLGEPVSWVGLLAGYSLAITIPTTLIIVSLTTLQINKGRRANLGFAIVIGTVFGLLVGTGLVFVTGGYSLLSAPAVGLLTSVGTWALQSRKSINTPDVHSNP